MKLFLNTASFQHIAQTFETFSRQEKVLVLAAAAFSGGSLFFGIRSCVRSMQQRTARLIGNDDVKFTETIRTLHIPKPDIPDFFLEKMKSLDEEKLAIDQRLQIPAVQKLVKSIESKSSDKERAAQCSVLLVILGIKPALALYNKEELEKLNVLPLMKEISEALPDIKIVYGARECYIVNEKPLTIFDPRNYLNNYDESISKEISNCFPAQNTSRTDQRLSYLLGYGPSWEALFVNGAHYSRSSHSEYRFAHFQEIGEVIARGMNENIFIATGMRYHDGFDKILPKGLLERKKQNCETIDDILGKTGTGQIYDGITMRTAYFKNSLCLKSHVLSKLTPKAE